MKITIINAKPVRRIRPSHRSITGKFSSLKTKTTHYFESSLERDYLILLENDSTVINYCAQPLTLKYVFEGKERRYTPDVLVHLFEDLNRKPLLCEIKYEADLASKKTELQPKFDAARRYADDHNFEFKVVTEKQIRTDYLQNIKFLSRYQVSSIDPILAKTIVRLLKKQNCITVRELLNSDDAGINGTILHTIWQLLSSKILMCDMHDKITMTTELWMNNNQYQNL